MRKWVVALVALSILVASVAGGAGYVWYQQAIHGIRESADEVVIDVPKGASVRRVGHMLVEAGLIDSELAVRIWLQLNRGLPAPKAGRHRLGRAMTVPQMFARLADKPMSEDVPLTLVEGWRLRDADAALAEAGRIEPGAYLAAAHSAEGYDIAFPIEGETLAGYLLPDTYLVPPGAVDARALVQRQLDAFAERFWRPHQGELTGSGRSLRTVVVMASLLEREEPKPEVRPKVAGVLYNRLDAGVPLGVDATSRYPLDDWSDRRAFLERLRDAEDPWNTRLRKGLPPGPIGAPSLPSLLAALRPEKTDAWYYLHDGSGRIHFSRNAREHEAKRKKYDVW